MDLDVYKRQLYTWNDEAIRFWKDQGILRNTVPLELNEKELRHRENAGSEDVYKRQPWTSILARKKPKIP